MHGERALRPLDLRLVGPQPVSSPFQRQEGHGGCKTRHHSEDRRQEQVHAVHAWSAALLVLGLDEDREQECVVQVRELREVVEQEQEE